LARHGGDGFVALLPFDKEERPDKLRGRGKGLIKEVPEGGCFSEAT
jgi:hypothetical protein